MRLFECVYCVFIVCLLYILIHFIFYFNYYYFQNQTKTKTNNNNIGLHINSLIELIIIQSELLELTANIQTSSVEGIVLNSYVDKGRGVVVDCLIKQGTLKISDIVMIGTTYGRIKNIYNDMNINISSAGPSTPCCITGELA